MATEKRTDEYGLNIETILEQINFPQSTDALVEGNSNKYFTNQRVIDIINPLLTALITDKVTEGSTNKYFTNQRVFELINPIIAALTTTNIPEGNNLYFTQARVANKADLVNGIVPKSQLPTNYTPASLKEAVKSGYFEQGELQGTQPSGSAADMRFCDTSYMYYYTFSAYDTDGSKYAWAKILRAY